MYTHHWYRPLDLDGGRYTEFVQDIRRFLQHLAGYHMKQAPSHQMVPLHEHMEYTLDNEHIFFRIGFSTWEDWRCWRRTPYERCHPERNPLRWHACSTQRPSAQSPYDLIVCALLIAFKHHFPESTLVSEAEASLWSEAVDWYTACFPERTVLPGPWSPEVAHLHLDDVVVLDGRAQRMGYRVSREKGRLFLIAQADRQNRLSHNQIFVDDSRGRTELAGWIRYLSATQAMSDHREKQWNRWSGSPGLLAAWTTQIVERWLSPSQEPLDVRKIEAQDGSGKYAWIPRRTLAPLIETPDDVKDYRFHLLEEDGQVCAVRVEERWNGYAEPRNPQRLAFFPIGIIPAVSDAPSFD